MAELHLSPSVKQKIVDERKNTAAEAKIVLRMLSTSAGFPVQLKHLQKRCPTKVIKGYPTEYKYDLFYLESVSFPTERYL